MQTFEALGLAEPLLRDIVAAGYQSPTPIQSEVIPLLLSGRDVLGIAQTGTGKTASFVLPMLHDFSIARKPAPARSCHALIITPTRELASQIADEIRRYSRFGRTSVTVVVGGVKPGPQVRALSRGVDIIVATPGRLLDHLAQRAVDLSHTKRVVFDEADQMLDLGFLPAIKRIGALLPKQRQTVLMSATMPTEIRRLAAQFQTNPAEVAVSPVARPIEQIAQSVIETDTASKRQVLANILGTSDVTRAIVFTRTKHGADKVNRHLLSVGLSATAIHGNKSQGQRQRALDAFRSGEAPILVATDIAARGIHVDDVSHVINYELPEVAEIYVHRIGRTARAGRSGIAISLCDHAERKLLRSIERLTGTPLSRNIAATEERSTGGPQRVDPAAAIEADAGPASRSGGTRPNQATDKPGRRRKRARRPSGHASGSAKSDTTLDRRAGL